jgi:NAD(P)-dependent dehydrogenase (short-subunit alcohol dehydrogenase family)
VRGLASIASQEYGKYGIRVNSICPGCEFFHFFHFHRHIDLLPVVETPFALAHPELLDAMKAKASLHRLGAPSEIASAALFLASDASAFVTGTTMKVDGGIVNWC